MFQKAAAGRNPLCGRWWGFILSVLILAALLTSCGSAGEADTGPSSSKAPASQPEALLPDASEAEAPSQAPTDKASGSQDFSAALSKAKSYCDLMEMSKNAIYKQLVSEAGEDFSAEAAQYAVDHLEADWNANALAKAKSYAQNLQLSKAAIYDQLVADAGESFTPEQAQYAIDNLEADWNANALAKAKSYQQDLGMSKEAIYDQLVAKAGEKFTPEQAQYAIDNLN